MFRAKDLDGRAVVDLESAKKIGYVDEIFLDPDGRSIAAYRVTEGSTLLGGGHKVLIPPSAVESVGPEAIMIRAGGARDEGGHSSDSLPRLSHVIGRKVVTQSGTLLGAIADVLLDSTDGQIHGYALKEAGVTGKINDMLNVHDESPDYVRADTDFRLSDELLIVPDDALMHGRIPTDDHATVTAGRGAPVGKRAPLADTPTRTTPAQRTERWDDVRHTFKSRWEQTSGGRGGIWEEHEPGYRYGWEMGRDDRYRGRSWSSIEPDLQRDWESRNPDRPWSRASGSVREGWGLNEREESRTTPAHLTSTEGHGLRADDTTTRSAREDRLRHDDDLTAERPASKRSLL